MKICYDNSYISSRACVLALGCFDGVHLGHAAVISEARKIADRLGCECTVWAFREPPRNFYYPGSSPMLTQACEKERLISLLGADNYVGVQFDSDIAGMSPEDFFSEIIIKKMKALHVVCGFNYSFGKNAAGNTDLLSRLCHNNGIGFTATDKISVGGITVSSSLIRKMISDGDTEEAAKLLGHNFSITCEVTDGQHLARRLGFPTVNQIFPPELAVPRRGVYISEITFDGKTFYGITNTGIRPTVGTDTLCAETNIFGYSGDLYGKTIRTELVRFMRPERKFESVEQLSEQVHRDIEYALSYTGSKNSN